MTTHTISTSSRFIKDRGPHADGEWRYQSECVTCNLTLSHWSDENTAAKLAESHQRFMGAA